MGNYFSLSNISGTSWILIIYSVIMYGLSLTTSITQLSNYDDSKKQKTFKDLTSTEIYYVSYIGFIGSLVGLVLSWTHLVWSWAKATCDSNFGYFNFNVFSIILFIFFLSTFSSCFITWYYCVINETATIDEILNIFDAITFSKAIMGLSSGLLVIMIVFESYSSFYQPMMQQPMMQQPMMQQPMMQQPMMQQPMMQQPMMQRF